MSTYGEAAVIAAHLLCDGGQTRTPRRAWDDAVTAVFPDSYSSRVKGCPRDAFLGLCSLGAVTGVKPGQYTSSEKNKGYVEAALAALRSDPALVGNKARLWLIATAGVPLQPNHQMDVLAALWLEGLVR